MKQIRQVTGYLVIFRDNFPYIVFLHKNVGIVQMASGLILVASSTCLSQYYMRASTCICSKHQHQCNRSGTAQVSLLILQSQELARSSAPQVFLTSNLSSCLHDRIVCEKLILIIFVLFNCSFKWPPWPSG